MEDTNKKISELLKELVDIEYNKSKIDAAIYMKKGSRIVANKVAEMNDCIIESAKAYGKKLEIEAGTSKIKSAIEANIVRNYTLALENVTKQYNVKYKRLLEAKEELKSMDYGEMLLQNDTANKRDEAQSTPEYAKEMKYKDSAKQALENAEYEKLDKIIQKMQSLSEKNNGSKLNRESRKISAKRARINEAIEKCDESIKECESERKKAIELIAGKKEDLLKVSKKTALVPVKSENIVKKFLIKMLNMLDREKRYTTSVTDVLSKRVRDISYKSLPNLKKKIKEEINEILKFISERNQNNTQKYMIIGIDKSQISKTYKGNSVKNYSYMPKNKKTEGKTSQNIENQTYNAMLGNSRSNKMWKINKMEEKLINGQKEKVLEKELA